MTKYFRHWDSPSDAWPVPKSNGADLAGPISKKGREIKVVCSHCRPKAIGTGPILRAGILETPKSTQKKNARRTEDASFFIGRNALKRARNPRIAHSGFQRAQKRGHIALRSRQTSSRVSQSGNPINIAQLLYLQCLLNGQKMPGRELFRDDFLVREMREEAFSPPGLPCPA